jgi:NADH:ubiquinone oxidoreductase subunit 5 (subunit L)/multisubunit Na+/H+ antiporter MnhA subunit
MAFHAREPKRILAYSTASQLGLTILASGLLAEKAGYFLLIAHAWSKAALFICVGVLAAKWRTEHASHSREEPGLSALAGSARGQGLLPAALLLAAASLGGAPLLGAALGKSRSSGPPPMAGPTPASTRRSVRPCPASRWAGARRRMLLLTRPPPHT